MFHAARTLVSHSHLSVPYKTTRKRIVENCGLNCGTELKGGDTKKNIRLLTPIGQVGNSAQADLSRSSIKKLYFHTELMNFKATDKA